MEFYVMESVPGGLLPEELGRSVRVQRQLGRVLPVMPRGFFKKSVDFLTGRLGGLVLLVSYSRQVR